MVQRNPSDLKRFKTLFMISESDEFVAPNLSEAHSQEDGLQSITSVSTLSDSPKNPDEFPTVSSLKSNKPKTKSAALVDKGKKVQQQSLLQQKQLLMTNNKKNGADEHHQLKDEPSLDAYAHMTESDGCHSNTNHDEEEVETASMDDFIIPPYETQSRDGILPPEVCDDKTNDLLKVIYPQSYYDESQSFYNFTTNSKQQPLLIPEELLTPVVVKGAKISKHHHHDPKQLISSQPVLTATIDFENAIEARKPIILIYDRVLSEYTVKWITVGNFLHKSAVLSGLATLALQCITLRHVRRAGALAQTLVTYLGNHLLISSRRTRQSPDPMSSPYFGDDNYNNYNYYQSYNYSRDVIPSSSFFNSPQTSEQRKDWLAFATLVGAGTSAFFTLLYTVFWSWDPCCKYQILRSLGDPTLTPLMRSTIIAHLNTASVIPTPAGRITMATEGSADPGSRARGPRDPLSIGGDSPIKTYTAPPCILIYKDDGRRKYLHNTISLLSIAFATLHYV